MKIYTTCFSAVPDLPRSIAPISIARKPPPEWEGLQYRKLAPKDAFFYRWRETRDNGYYVAHFNSEVLSVLDAGTVVRELFSLADGYDAIALVCYEAPGEFCHRRLVADWLSLNGFFVTEYVLENGR